MCAGQYGSLTRIVAPKVYDKVSLTPKIDKAMGLGPVDIPPPPAPPQDVKMPDMARTPKRRTGNTTMLTGSGGVGKMNTGGTTLLGG